MEHEGLLKFRSSEKLADVTLTKAAVPEDPPFKGHKVVLAAASGLFFDLFTKENQELVTDFRIPPLVETKSGVTGDPYNRAFTYMYCDQTFAKIKDDISPNNVFQLYSVAYTLRLKKLVDDLEQLIVNELLDSENCINFYLDGIRFNSKRITDACEKLLVQEFMEVCTSKDGHFFLNQLPLTYFQNLMKGDALNVDNETRVLECVEKYIRHRAGIEPDKTEEEKKREREQVVAAAAGGAVPPDPEEEEKKKKEDAYNALDDKGKVQWRYNEEVEKLRREADERMRVRGLRSEHKRELFKTIRYAFLTHQELLKCSRDPLFNEAKEYVVEGLTFKIEPEEVLDKEDTLISLKERDHYVSFEPEDPRDLYVKAPQHHRLDDRGVPYQEHLSQEVGLKGKLQKKDTHRKYNEPIQTSPVRQARVPQKNVPGRNAAGYPKDVYGKHKGATAGAKTQLSYPARNLAGGMDDTFARADTHGYEETSIPPYPPVKFGVPGQGKSKKYGPQGMWTQKQAQVTSFDYSYDFDENGAFYFLGTEGGRKIWQNPHTIGQVQAFASSIGFGSVHDLVGRK